MPDLEYIAEANRIVDERIVQLRGLPPSDAAALPEVDGRDIEIAGKRASVTVFRQDSPYGLENRTLVTVLVALPRWFGMAAHHIERGLVFAPDGSVREASLLELQNSGG